MVLVLEMLSAVGPNHFESFLTSSDFTRALIRWLQVSLLLAIAGLLSCHCFQMLSQMTGFTSMQTLIADMTGLDRLLTLAQYPTICGELWQPVERLRKGKGFNC